MACAAASSCGASTLASTCNDVGCHDAVVAAGGGVVCTGMMCSTWLCCVGIGCAAPPSVVVVANGDCAGINSGPPVTATSRDVKRGDWVRKRSIQAAVDIELRAFTVCSLVVHTEGLRLHYMLSRKG